jgi:hypothetical protein
LILSFFFRADFVIDDAAQHLDEGQGGYGGAGAWVNRW